MKDHPIIMSAPMVKALLAGRKTMTRRLLRAPYEWTDPAPSCPTCLGNPYWGKTLSSWDRCACVQLTTRQYAVADLLWVREAWRIEGCGSRVSAEARIEDGESALVPEIAKPFLEDLLQALRMKVPHGLHLGCGLGTATLHRPARAVDLFRDKVADSSRIDHQIYAWPLTDVQPFAKPIPCRGAQGFWKWPDLREAAA